MRLVTKAAEVLNTLHGGAAVKMMFIDGTGENGGAKIDHRSAG